MNLIIKRISFTQTFQIVLSSIQNLEFSELFIIFFSFSFQMKVNIKDQLPKYLGEVKLLTTKCCIQECEKLGPSIFGATVILKQFGIHKCTHEEDTKPAMKCLK